MRARFHGLYAVTSAAVAAIMVMAIPAPMDPGTPSLPANQENVWWASVLDRALRSEHPQDIFVTTPQDQHQAQIPSTDPHHMVKAINSGQSQFNHLDDSVWMPSHNFWTPHSPAATHGREPTRWSSTDDAGQIPDAWMHSHPATPQHSPYWNPGQTQGGFLSLSDTGMHTSSINGNDEGVGSSSTRYDHDAEQASDSPHLSVFDRLPAIETTAHPNGLSHLPVDFDALRNWDRHGPLHQDISAETSRQLWTSLSASQNGQAASASHFRIAQPPTPPAQNSAVDLSPDVFHAESDATEATGTRESKWIPAAKFLAYHPQFSQVQIDGKKVGGLHGVAEMSPDANDLKDAVRQQLFDNKLEWEERGDTAIAYLSHRLPVRQFMQRFNNKGILFASKDLIGLPGKREARIYIAPHRSYSQGSILFDGRKHEQQMLFSFWTPAFDDKEARLQLVGAGTLSIGTASDVIKVAAKTEAHSAPAPLGGDADRPETPLFPPPTFMRAPLSNPTKDRFASTGEWLKFFPAVNKLPSHSQTRLKISNRLMSAFHSHAEDIKVAVNSALFGNNVKWESRPGEVMMDTASNTAAQIFRHHKRIPVVFATHPDLLMMLPYQTVFLPYQIPGKRSRLFDSSLNGKAHTFTLWAASSPPGSPDSDVYYFVSGGSIEVEKTPDAMRAARATMRLLADVTARQLARTHQYLPSL